MVDSGLYFFNQIAGKYTTNRSNAYNAKRRIESWLLQLF